MDNGKGELVEISEELYKEKVQEEHGEGVFQRGETLTIRGSLFKVQKIYKGGIKLKLLPQPKKKSN